MDTFYNGLNANDQDSLNSAAGGNFLDKMPRECLRIIKSKSKVRNSRNKAVVAKVSLNSSTPGISPDVASLTTEVSELKNLMKTMLIDKQKVMAASNIPVSAEENLGDPIDIRVDIIHPEPVAAVAFPAAAIEELTALRFRADIAEQKIASLRAMDLRHGGNQEITRTRERQARVKIEHKLLRFKDPSEVAFDLLRDALLGIWIYLNSSHGIPLRLLMMIEELMKDQPLSADASPTALSPGYIADSNPEEDKEDPEEDPADHSADG
ncbi:hypothetical protein Tco_0967950 [Tanacetum coccineum]